MYRTFYHEKENATEYISENYESFARSARSTFEPDSLLNKKKKYAYLRKLII